MAQCFPRCVGGSESVGAVGMVDDGDIFSGYVQVHSVIGGTEYYPSVLASPGAALAESWSGAGPNSMPPKIREATEWEKQPCGLST